MSDIEDLQTQIADLQSRVIYQEDLLQSLNDIVANQDQTITLLKSQLKRWESRLDDVSNNISSGGQSVSEKPPHY